MIRNYAGKILLSRVAMLVSAWLVLASPAFGLTILLVTDGNGSLTTQETARRTTFQGWGHTVSTVWDGASQATIDAAMATADLVYVSEECASADVGYKFRLATIGVVYEEPLIDTEMGLSTSDAGTDSGTQINLVDPAYGTGLTTILNTGQLLIYFQGTPAIGYHDVANTAGGQQCMGTVEAGAPLANTYNGNSVAAGRRLRLPWGGDSFIWTELNSTGLAIVQSGLVWAAEKPLLLHWKLDESSGTSVADASTYSRTGTRTGTGSWVSAVRHRGLSLSGAGKVEVTSLLGNPTSFSLAAWVNVASLDSSGSEVVSLGDHSYLRVTSSTVTAGFYNGSGYTNLTYSATLAGSGWRHLAATFDEESDTFRLYLDGAQVATTTTTAKVSYAGLGTKTTVGAHGNANTAYDLNGIVDDVRAYNKALTLGEVVETYGMVGRWRLNETSGTTAADSSGIGNNGTLNNGPVWTNGTRAGSLQFDGNNDYISVAYDASLSLGDDMSFAAWIKTSSLAAGNRVIVGKGTNYYFDVNGDEVAFAFHNGSAWQSFVTTNANLKTAVWHHVAASFNNSTDTVRIYVDGVVVYNSTTTATPALSTSGLEVGRLSSAEYWNGQLDDVRVYNRVIQQEEVTAMYGLVGYWKLAETSGTTAADSSGMGNAGAVTGGANWTANTAGYGVFDFNGSAQYISAANATELQPTESVTLAGWVRGDSWGTGSDADVVIRKGDANPNNYQLAIANGRVELLLDGNDGAGFSGNTVLETGKWHHVAAVWDGATAKIYVNGVLDNAPVARTGLINVDTRPVYLGGRAGADLFDGQQRDLRLYDRALSAAEIMQLFGLVGHWKFDESSGAAFADSSGLGNSGAHSAGSPNWIAGVYNNGIEFDGPADAAATTNAFNPPGTGTVAFWFRSDGAPASRQRLCGLGGDFEVWQDPDGLVRFDLTTDGNVGGFVTTMPLDSAGRWYHVVAVFDSDDDAYEIYVNGQLHRSGVSTTAMVPQTGAALSFGTRTGTTERFDGAIDDFRIYNRRLAPEEVFKLFGLMGWYKLDELSGTVAVDSTGLGNAGTYSGSPTLGVTGNGGPGMGTSVGLNGSNYVQIAGLMGQSPSVSVAGWAKLDAKDTNGADFVSLGDCFLIRLANSTVYTTAAYHLASGTTSVDASGVIEDTGWHHFAAVLDAGNTLKLYIDGIEAASTAATSAISYSGLGANTFIGRHGNSGSTHDFTGRVDDVRIFNRAIKPDEIYQLYRGSRINGIKILTWTETLTHCVDRADGAGRRARRFNASR